jgi:ketosteroid isomerase-like protein
MVGWRGQKSLDPDRSSHAEWSQSATLTSLDKFVAYADDASVPPFNDPLVTGKDNIRQFFTQLFSKPGWAVTFEPTKIEVAKSTRCWL